MLSAKCRWKVTLKHQGQLVGTIPSKWGSMQGDPLGGHYFSLSIQPLMATLAADTTGNETFQGWIMDDLTVAGSQRNVARIAELLETMGPQYGLKLNAAKTKIYCKQDLHPSLQAFGFAHSAEGISKLLGSPVGTDAFRQRAANKRTQEKMADSRQLLTSYPRRPD